MRYFVLEAKMAGEWTTGRYYKAASFRPLFEFLQLNPGQRLRAITKPATGTLVWVFEKEKGLVRWTT